MSRLIVVRHARTAIREIDQKPDDSIDEAGKVQAERLAERLVGLEVGQIYTSTYMRAKETAMIVAEKQGMEFKEDVRLREVGLWLPNRAIINRSNPDYAATVRVLRSAKRAVNSFLQSEIFLDPDSRDTIIVSHGNLIRVLLALLLRLRIETLSHLQIDNTSVTILERDSSVEQVFYRLVGINDTSHLTSTR